MIVENYYIAFLDRYQAVFNLPECRAFFYLTKLNLNYS